MITIRFFGQLTEITGRPTLEKEDSVDTDELIRLLEQQYPALKESRYKIAVNRNIVQSNTALQAGAEVALLPPFSGG